MFAPAAPTLVYVNFSTSIVLLVAALATFVQVCRGSKATFAYFLLAMTCYFALVSLATSLSWALVYPVTTSEGQVIAYEQSYYATCLCAVFYQLLLI